MHEFWSCPKKSMKEYIVLVSSNERRWHGEHSVEAAHASARPSHSRCDVKSGARKCALQVIRFTHAQ